MRELIIEKPRLQSRTQRIGYRFLTVGVWAFFLYLVRPLFTLVAWFFGFSIVSETMIADGGAQALLDSAGWYGAVVVAIAAALGGWSLVNYWRFRGLRRRRQAPGVTLAEMARRFELKPAALLQCRRAQWMAMEHDPCGRIVRIDLPGAPRAPADRAQSAAPHDRAAAFGA